MHEHLRTFQLAPGDKIWKNVTNNKLFLIRHYAGKDRAVSTREKSTENALHGLHDSVFVGDVVYSVDGFLDKNRDTLFDDFKRLLFHSHNPIVSSMWPEGEKSITSVTRRPLTAGTIFRNSMISLSTLLSSKVRSDRSFDAGTPVSSLSSNPSMCAVLNRMRRNRPIYSIKPGSNIRLLIWVY